MNRRPLVAVLCTPAILRTRTARAVGREITVPIASNSFGTSGLRVARDLGLFERQGLDARIVVADSSSRRVQPWRDEGPGMTLSMEWDGDDHRDD